MDEIKKFFDCDFEQTTFLDDPEKTEKLRLFLEPQFYAAFYLISNLAEFF